MDLKAVVISGEAPESDDESVNVTTGKALSNLLAANSCGTIISGEAQESDDDMMSTSSVSGAVNTTVCPPYIEAKPSKVKRSFIKYNSLLHKKLYECNELLDRDIRQISNSAISSAVQDLTGVNKNLLKSEIILQEAACQLRHASNRSREASLSLHQFLDANFLHSIKS